MNTRAECPACGRCVQVRLDGALRQHRDNNKAGCDGGGRNHAAEAAESERLTLAAEDCEYLGMSPVWEAVSANPQQYVVRDILAALARCLVETQVLATSQGG